MLHGGGARLLDSRLLLLHGARVRLPLSHLPRQHPLVALRIRTSKEGVALILSVRVPHSRYASARRRIVARCGRCQATADRVLSGTAHPYSKAGADDMRAWGRGLPAGCQSAAGTWRGRQHAPRACCVRPPAPTAPSAAPRCAPAAPGPPANQNIAINVEPPVPEANMSAKAVASMAGMSFSARRHAQEGACTSGRMKQFHLHPYTFTCPLTLSCTYGRHKTFFAP